MPYIQIPEAKKLFRRAYMLLQELEDARTSLKNAIDESSDEWNRMHNNVISIQVNISRDVVKFWKLLTYQGQWQPGTRIALGGPDQKLNFINRITDLTFWNITFLYEKWALEVRWPVWASKTRWPRGQMREPRANGPVLTSSLCLECILAWTVNCIGQSLVFRESLSQKEGISDPTKWLYTGPRKEPSTVVARGVKVRDTW